MLFVTCSVAEFCVNVSLSIIVFCTYLLNILIMAKANVSSMNGGSTFINFCSSGFNTMYSFGKIGIDLFKKLKQQSHELAVPSSWNIFLIPKPKSTFSCILDTNVYISNLCPCISTIIGIMNKTLMNCPFCTWIFCVLDVNFDNEWIDLQSKWCHFDINDLLTHVSSSIWHSVPSNSFPTV